MRMAIPVRENSENGEAISGSGMYLYNFWSMYIQKCETLIIFQISGTKLKCPFCEKTYGYETKLLAHIRQRHQGIRVSCPYCPRTFTRNNTVRRHVQREHAGNIESNKGRKFFPKNFIIFFKKAMFFGCLTSILPLFQYLFDLMVEHISNFLWFFFQMYPHQFLRDNLIMWKMMK